MVFLWMVNSLHNTVYAAMSLSDMDVLGFEPLTFITVFCYRLGFVGHRYH